MNSVAVDHVDLPRLHGVAKGSYVVLLVAVVLPCPAFSMGLSIPRVPPRIYLKWQVMISH